MGQRRFRGCYLRYARYVFFVIYMHEDESGRGWIGGLQKACCVIGGRCSQRGAVQLIASRYPPSEVSRRFYFEKFSNDAPGVSYSNPSTVYRLTVRVGSSGSSTHFLSGDYGNSTGFEGSIVMW